MPKQKTANRYRVSISPDSRGDYRTEGDIRVGSSRFPMIDCARALMLAGAEPTATLAATTHEGAAIAPVSLAKLVRAYHPPKIDHRRGGASLNVDE